MKFTGEVWIPGKTPKPRIEADHKERYDFASQYVNKKICLDIACGAGYAVRKYLSEGAMHVKCVDISQECVKYAWETNNFQNASYEVCDICQFESNLKFEFISCFETIEHVQEYELALDKLYSALSPSGTLIISSPNRIVTSPMAKGLKSGLLNQFHAQEFTVSEFQETVKAHGFNVKGLYGQRQYKRRSSAKEYNHPKTQHESKEIASPKVGLLQDGMEPRYIILVCEK